MYEFSAGLFSLLLAFQCFTSVVFVSWFDIPLSIFLWEVLSFGHDYVTWSQTQVFDVDPYLDVRLSVCLFSL